MKRFSVAAVCCLALFSAEAGHISETLTLSPGWNAVYIESTPDNSVPADFFADLPVLRVGCYESSVYSSTGQIASDGTALAQKPAAFYVWMRGEERDSTLQSIVGGHCYFIYATNTAVKTFYGKPRRPKVSWQVSDGGFATIAGVSIPAGETVASSLYFREGPLSPNAVNAPYSIGGTDAAAPKFTKVLAFRGSPALSALGAYAFEGSSIADWAGVVKVSVPSLSETIDFASGVRLCSFSVQNAGTTNRTIRVSYGESELPGETKPPLKVFIPRNGTNTFGWTAFDIHDFNLDPGQSKTLALAVDKSDIPSGTVFAGLVTVSDLSGTKMRVRVPVTAAIDGDSTYSAAYPKGLWYGNVKLSQVDRLSDGKPVPSGGEMKMSAMVFVDANGAAHLLQRVAVGTAGNRNEDGSYDVRLWPETADVPSGYSVRRISTMFPDVARRSVDAAEGRFGDRLRFDWTVAADARDNPFRHAWHPDHGKGFAVTNSLELSWYTESNVSTWKFNPDEVTYGICTWTLGGLSGTGNVTMRGTFALKRMFAISKIEEL